MDEIDEEPGSSMRSADGCGLTALPGIGEHPGFTLWRVSLALVLMMFTLALAGVHGLVAWVVLTVVVAWCVSWAHPATATAAAVETWLVQTGFGVHHGGLLTFGRSDLLHLAAVVTVVVAVAVVSRRSVRRGPPAPPRAETPHLRTESVDS